MARRPKGRRTEVNAVILVSNVYTGPTSPSFPSRGTAPSGRGTPGRRSLGSERLHFDPAGRSLLLPRARWGCGQPWCRLAATVPAGVSTRLPPGTFGRASPWRADVGSLRESSPLGAGPAGKPRTGSAARPCRPVGAVQGGPRVIGWVLSPAALRVLETSAWSSTSASEEGSLLSAYLSGHGSMINGNALS